MPAREFGEFLSHSLDVLAREARAAYQSLGTILDQHTIKFEVDGPPVVLGFASGRHRRLRSDHSAEVDVKVNRKTILDLVDARVSLQDAIEQDFFFLRGKVDDIDWFYDALLAYLDGAIRSDSFPGLLGDFRDDATHVLSHSTP